MITITSPTNGATFAQTDMITLSGANGPPISWSKTAVTSVGADESGAFGGPAPAAPGDWSLNIGAQPVGKWKITVIGPLGKSASVTVVVT